MNEVCYFSILAINSPPASQCCFPFRNPFHFTTPTENYAQHLQSVYKLQKAPDVIDSSTIPFIQPLMIEVNTDSTEGIAIGNFEAVKEREAVVSLSNLSSIPFGSRYLIEGPPGIGKTKLAFELCRQWYNKDGFLDYTLFLFIELQDKSIQKLSNTDDSLKKLLGFYLTSETWKDATLQSIIDNSGHGILILFEGFNELKEQLQSDSVFLNIIKGKLLPKATVIVTSQPAGTKQIKKATCDVHIVNILGFDSSAIDQFLNFYFDEKEIQSFRSFVPQSLASSIFIPIILRIISFVFKKNILSSQEVLTTTKLYEKLVRQIVRNSLHEERNPSLTLPALIKLGRQAWIGVQKNKLTFKRAEDLDTLGLMQKRSSSSSGSVKLSFLHYTVQEFLAANYVRLKFPDRIQEVFQKGHHHSRFNGTLKFLAGLTGSIINEPLPNQISNFNLLQQLYEAQSNVETKQDVDKGGRNGKEDEDQKEEADKVKKAEIEVFGAFPQPHDMLALGYCIGRSSAHWKIIFTLRSLCREHMDLLKLGIGKCPSGKIIKLHMSLNDLSNDGVKVLFSIPHSVATDNLVELNLRGNGLHGSEVSSDISDVILSSPCLEKFIFHDNDFSIESDEQLSVVSAVCQSKSLQSVSFSNLSPDECKTLFSHKHTSLKTVELYQLQTDSIASLTTSIIKSSIATLKLHQSEVLDDHLASLPQRLSDTSIKRLALINCALSSQAVHFITIIVGSSKIKRLDLSHNSISDDAVSNISQMVSSKRLEHLTLVNNHFTADAIDKLVRIADEVKKTKLHLDDKWKEHYSTSRWVD